MKIAIVSNTGLGDGLWMMVVAHNFYRHGHSVTLHNNYLWHLRSLFPHVNVEAETLEPKADLVIVQQYGPKIPNAECIEKETLDQKKTYVENLRDLCQNRFGLLDSQCDLGIQIPDHWRHRANPHRVILHPVSANAWKDWPAAKYIRLAKRLHNYEPIFVGSARDMAAWKSPLEQAHLPAPLSLDWLGLAQLIYESGYLIGNDGSLGHLASALHIPTLSLFDRKSRALFWRPGWGPGEVVLPYPILPGRGLRKRYWKHFLTVNCVYLAFKKL